VREIAFTTRNPAVIALAGDGRVARVDLSVGGGVLLGELRQDSRAAIIEANLTSVDLGSMVRTCAAGSQAACPCAARATICRVPPIVTLRTRSAASTRRAAWPSTARLNAT
jgi:hypothetical protein